MKSTSSWVQIEKSKKNKAALSEAAFCTMGSLWPFRGLSPNWPKKCTKKKKNQVHSCVRFPPSAWIHEQWPWLIGSFPSIRLGGADAASAKMKRHCFTGRRGRSGIKEAERYLLMAGYSSCGPGGGPEGGVGGCCSHKWYIFTPPLSLRSIFKSAL